MFQIYVNQNAKLQVFSKFEFHIAWITKNPYQNSFHDFIGRWYEYVVDYEVSAKEFCKCYKVKRKKYL